MKAFSRLASLASLGIGLVLASSAASAAATYCSASPPATGLSTSDVNYSVTGSAPYTPANDCYGVVQDNINKQTSLSQWGGGWTYADATDAAATQVSMLGGQFTFTLTEDTRGGAASGNYVLTGTDDNGVAQPNFPIGLDFVLGVKASNFYALYFFDNVEFDGSGGGQWNVRFENKGGNFPNLSHLIAFVRGGELPPCVPGTPGCGQQVPEPGTLALLGLGLVGLGLSRRRQRVS